MVTMCDEVYAVIMMTRDPEGMLRDALPPGSRGAGRAKGSQRIPLSNRLVDVAVANTDAAGNDTLLGLRNLKSCAEECLDVPQKLYSVFISAYISIAWGKNSRVRSET